MYRMRNHKQLIGLNRLCTDLLTDRAGLYGLEVGSFAGESAKVFLNTHAFVAFYCVDAWSKDFATPAIVNDLAPAEVLFDKTVGMNPVVHKLKGTSQDMAKKFPEDSLDFLYIDARHDYDYVLADLKSWVPKVHQGGIIAGHDWVHNWPGVPKACKEFFHRDPVKIYRDTSWFYINK